MHETTLSLICFYLLLSLRARLFTFTHSHTCATSRLSSLLFELLLLFLLLLKFFLLCVTRSRTLFYPFPLLYIPPLYIRLLIPDNSSSNSLLSHSHACNSPLLLTCSRICFYFPLTLARATFHLSSFVLKLACISFHSRASYFLPQLICSLICFYPLPTPRARFFAPAHLFSKLFLPLLNLECTTFHLSLLSL